jgi:N,N'-diacetyllegionaminate synthase
MHSRVIIIAEAGVNHNGSMEVAKRLIDAAKLAGADYVKFQTFKADNLVSKTAKMASYQQKNMLGRDNSQYNMLKQLELGHEQHLELIDYCNTNGIKFFSTAFDAEGVQYLNGLGLDFCKIPSGEVTNFPYLRAIALCGKPVLLSTGMCTSAEVQAAINVLNRFSLATNPIIVLHCNTEYPTPMADVNLQAMITMQRDFNVSVGYSDHTLGIEVPIAAVAMGACVIEKHLTLDRTLEGPDHAASLEPSEFKEMVTAIRNIELAMSGNGEKQASNSEIKNKLIARKSIHLARAMSKGDKLAEADLLALRPGGGVSAMQWEQVIGKVLTVDKASYDMLHNQDLA